MLRELASGLANLERDGVAPDGSVPFAEELHVEEPGIAGAAEPDEDDVRGGAVVRRQHGELVEHLHPAGTDDVPACLVAREAPGVDEQHPRAAAGQHRRGHGARRTRSRDHDIE